MTAAAVVLDTNIALDLLVFDDAAVGPLRQALAEGRLQWLATEATREEWRRVLDYPQILRRAPAGSPERTAALDAFDAMVRLVPTAAKAPFTCKDGDDQKFIDLAVAHRATLVSKDAAVLCMARRLSRLGVCVCRQWNSDPPPDLWPEPSSVA
ncbi:putative toxin-antitoxin system toxin component, PIN family [Hydrogenophaga sp. R2]|uniref:putative toxin-antitoxin system toxin component, PIN family n=1 Tax=Hydrogenophaga sp. R2 TaxID=3132827 RepID=UPI003CE9B71F